MFVIAGLVAALVLSLARHRLAHAELKRLTAANASLQARMADAAASAPEAPLFAPAAPASAPAADAPSLTDHGSGLHNEDYFRVTLEARVAAARRHLRPVAVVLVQVVDEGSGELSDPSLVGDCVRSTLRDADTSCRLSDGVFALLLEDTPENGAVWTVERMRRALAAAGSGYRLWAGIACYPAHAFDGGELHVGAEKALTAAREWHQDRIEVATASA